MLTTTEKRKLRTQLAQYEGVVPHLYLDAKGYVTVAVGHLIQTVTDALKLRFIDAATKKLATPEQIKKEFETISKQPKNRVASFYRPHTRLILTPIRIGKLTNAHIAQFYKELKQIYPDFDRYPQEVRLALFDLIFNVGATNLRTAWPNFNKAIKAQDWQKAAAHSRRKPPVSAARNLYVKTLLEKAARDAGKEQRQEKF